MTVFIVSPCISCILANQALPFLYVTYIFPSYFSPHTTSDWL